MFEGTHWRRKPSEWGYRSSPGFEGRMDLGSVERLPGTGADHRGKCGDHSASDGVRRNEEPGLQAVLPGDGQRQPVTKDPTEEKSGVGLIE